MSYEYKVKGIIHAKILNPWKVNKEGIFEEPTEELNKLSKNDWEVITAFPAGNNDRAIYILKRKK